MEAPEWITKTILKVAKDEKHAADEARSGYGDG